MAPAFALLDEEAQKQKILEYLVFASWKGFTTSQLGALVSELTTDTESGASLRQFLKEEIQKKFQVQL